MGYCCKLLVWWWTSGTESIPLTWLFFADPVKSILYWPHQQPAAVSQVYTTLVCFLVTWTSDPHMNYWKISGKNLLRTSFISYAMTRPFAHSCSSTRSNYKPSIPRFPVYLMFPFSPRFRASSVIRTIMPIVCRNPNEDICYRHRADFQVETSPSRRLDTNFNPWFCSYETTRIHFRLDLVTKPISHFIKCFFQPIPTHDCLFPSLPDRNARSTCTIPNRNTVRSQLLNYFMPQMWDLITL